MSQPLPFRTLRPKPSNDPRKLPSTGRISDLALHQAARKLRTESLRGSVPKPLKSTGHGNGVGSNFSRRSYHNRSTGADGKVIWSGHDLLGVLTVSDDSEMSQDIIEFQINPSSMGFKALAKECQLHQQYKFTNFQVHVPGTASSFVNGDGMGYYTRDVNALPEEGIDGLQVGWYLGGEQCTFKNGKTFHMPHFPNLPNLYCQDLDSDKRLVNQCTFTFKVVNPPSTYSSGPSEGPVDLRVEFWASYTCEFFVRGLVDTPLQEQQACLVGSPITGVKSANDPLGYGSALEKLNLNMPSGSKNFIPGLAFGKMAIPAADGKNETPTQCSVIAMLSGFGLDMGCGWNFDLSVAAVNFAEGFPMSLASPVIAENLTVKLARGMNYTSATSNVEGVVNVEVDVPGATIDMYFPEGYWYFDTDGSLNFVGEAGLAATVCWAYGMKYNQDVTDFGTPEDMITYTMVNMTCSDSGPAMFAWAGEATVEGKAWRAWTNLGASAKSKTPFKEFLKEYRELRNPRPKDTEDDLKLRELVERVKESKTPVLLEHKNTSQVDAARPSSSDEAFELIPLSQSKGSTPRTVPFSTPQGPQPAAQKQSAPTLKVQPK